MTFAFLGGDYAPVDLARAAPLRAFLRAHPQPLSGYTLGSLFAWSSVYHYGWRILDAEPTLLIACHAGDARYRHLLQPIGELGRDAEEALLAELGRQPYPVSLYAVSERFLDGHPAFVKHFTFSDERAAANYLYESAALADLAGPRYASNRRLFRQAERAYEWTCEPLAEALIPACLQLLDEIGAERGEPAPAGSRANELAALKATLAQLDRLDQTGLLLRVAGRPMAFSIFEEQTPDTAVVHFEKALRRPRGLALVIRTEVARLLRARGYAHINAEQDLGEEGLRLSKMIDAPTELRPSYVLTWAA